MSFIKIIAFWLLFLSSYKGCTNDVDMTFTLDIGDTRNLAFNQIYDFSISIINNGPEDAGTLGASDLPNAVFAQNIGLNENGFIDIYFFENNSIEDECTFFIFFFDPAPGGEVGFSFSFETPIIPANSSITCYGHYVLGFESGEKIIEFFASFGFDNDVDMSNNTQDIVFGIRPRAIPILNRFSLLVIFFSFLLIGLRAFSRNRIETIKTDLVSF